MRKSIAIITCLTMLLSMFSFSSFAVDVTGEDTMPLLNNDEQILEILNSINEYNAGKIQDGTQTANPDAYELQLEDELESYGAEVLTPVEAYELMGMEPEEYAPYVTTPTTTTNVRWYSWTSSLTQSGTTYSVQHVSASARTANTNLAIQAVGKAIFTGKSYALYSAQRALAYYANYAASSVAPILDYLPVDIFNSSDVSKFTDASTTYSGVATVIFSYVKVSGQSDYYQTLSLVSNQIVYSGDVSVTGIKNGSPDTRTVESDFTKQATYYGSTSRAVSNYINGTSGQSLVGKIVISFAEISSGNGATSYSITVPGPTAPSQVTG